MNTAFCTLATGQYLTQGGTANLIKSAKHFYPNIPFLTFSDSEINTILANYQETISEASQLLPLEIRPQPPYQPPEMGFYHALIGRTLAKDYDLVIYIDCDSLIVAPLTEIFDQDYELACVRNVADNGKAGCFDCVVEGIESLKYVNGGFTACRNKDFWDHWTLLNLKMNFDAPLAEQYTLNVLFHSGLYKTLLLDPPQEKIYYGLASAYGTTTHWDSWQNIIIEDNLLKLDGKTIKILHEAGGSHLPKMSMEEGLLPEHVATWIKTRILK